MEIVLGSLSVPIPPGISSLPFSAVSACDFNSPRSKNFHFLSNKYLEIRASMNKQQEKCCEKCQRKVTANTECFSNTSRSFPHYGQGTFSCCFYQDVFDACSNSWPVTPCMLQGMAMHRPATLLGSVQEQEQGRGSGTSFPKMQWAFAPIFSTIPLHSSVARSMELS